MVRRENESDSHCTLESVNTGIRLRGSRKHAELSPAVDGITGGIDGDYGAWPWVSSRLTVLSFGSSHFYEHASRK